MVRPARAASKVRRAPVTRCVARGDAAICAAPRARPAHRPQASTREARAAPRSTKCASRRATAVSASGAKVERAADSLPRVKRLKVLVLFAHPAFEKSRVNRELVGVVKDLAGITFRDLYEIYPELDIDVRREQELLVEHDVIVFHHPFYWYSMPAILKEWQDLVLEHGWAYGTEGHALDGKITFHVISTGGPEAAYQRGGHNRFTVRELLAPQDQTAHLCRMKFVAPFVVHSSLRLVGNDDVKEPAARYRRLLEGVRDGRFDVDAAQAVDNLNTELDRVLRGTAA
jgi:glutathione-regulated potassium-efflux system ancillary protein KefG